MKEKGVAISRRGFLKGAALAGSAAAMSSLGQSVTANRQVEGTAEESGEQSRGYRETPHILEYYEKARF